MTTRRILLVLAALVVAVFAFLTTSHSDGLRLLYPVKQTNGAWRVSWSSVPGTTYELQRAANDQLSSTNWVLLTSLSATGTTSFYDDFTSAARRFYRVWLKGGTTSNTVLGDVAHFVPLNADGQPVDGGTVFITADGQVGAFEYRPGGRSLAGAGQGLVLRFPTGAQVLSNGTPALQFTSVIAAFGSNSPFQFATNLVLTNMTGRQLPLEPLDVPTLATLFGLAATNGLEVTLYGRFPLTLRSGVFDDCGLRSGQVALRHFGLPLPGASGLYSDWIIDLTAKGGLRIPFAGQFTLPDNSDFAPVLVVATNRPLWVEFKPDGDIALGGRAEVAFPQGPNFTVDFSFDDPHYFLQMAATTVHLPLLGSLAELLPPVPTVPGSTNAAQLAACRTNLEYFDKALLHFSAATLGAAPATVDTRPSVPDQAFTTAASVLEAWGFVAKCTVNLPAAALSGSLQHAGQSAAAAQGFRTTLAQHLALWRLKQDLAEGGLRSDAAVQAELEAALATSTAAVLERAKDCNSVATLGQMQEVMNQLLQIETVRQQLDLAPNPQIVSTLQKLLQCFTDNFTANLGVQAGLYTPPAGGRIAGMNQFAALDTLRQLLTVLTLAQQLGLDDQITAPVQETLGQLALRLWTVLNGALTAAETAGDYAGFTYALEDTLDFIALRQSGLFPSRPELVNLPGAASLGPLAQRLGAVMAADLAKPAGEPSLNNLKQDLVRLTKILQQLPANASYPSAPMQRASDRLEARLATAFNTLNALSLAELQIVLEAGIVQADLQERFHLTPAVSWETARLPLLITRLAALAQQSNAWSVLHAAANTLLTEGDRQGGLGKQARRRLYLEKTAQLLAASRTVAVALWQNEAARRAANPLLQAADLVLPGDIYLDRIAGALRYDRLGRSLAGALSGQMRLPQFNLSLNVENASLSSSGALDLNASGELTLPPGSSRVSLSIPARRPLRLSFRPPSQLRLAANLRMALDNGMALESAMALADPVYSFGLAAEGLRFDLATNLVVMMPSFPDAANFGPEVGRTLNDYYQGLAASLDALSGLTNGLHLGQVGTPPEFQESTLSFSTAPLATFANGILIDLTNNVLRDFSATTNALKEQLQHLASDTRAQRDQLEQSEVFLRGKALCNLYKSLQLKAYQASRAGKSTADCNAILDSSELTNYVQACVEVASRLMTRPDSTLVSNGPAVIEAVGSVLAGLQCCNRNDGGLVAQFQDFQNRAYTSYLLSLGIDPATGKAVANSPTFAALPPEKLYHTLSNLLVLEANNQRLGTQPSAVELTTRQTVAMRYRELLVQDLGKRSYTNAADHGEIGRLSLALLKFWQLHTAGAFEYPAEPVLQLDGSRRVINEANREIELSQNILGVVNQYATALDSNEPQARAVFLSLPRKYQQDPFGLKELSQVNARLPVPAIPPTSGLARMLNRAFTNELNEIEWKLQSQWTTERMAEGVELADRLVKLATWAHGYNPPALPLISNLFATNLTVKLIDSAQAKTNAWLLNRYIQLTLDAAQAKVGNDANVLSNAFLMNAKVSLQACSNIVGNLKNLLPRQRPCDLRLPGDVVVRRAAGSITFNRETAYLQGAFSGRLEFPDLQNAFFEITRATLDNNLNFQIAANTSGPLPLNGVRLTASVLASNGPNRSLAFAGSGVLTPTNGPDLDVGLSFNTDTRTLSFDTRAGTLQSWRLTDNLVLFEAGFGFTLRPEAQSGQLRVQGSAGFFAKGPLPETGAAISGTNFHLFADHLQAALTLVPGQIDLAFSNGTLHLPAFCYPTNMAELCPGPQPAGPAIALNPLNPIRATFRDGPAPVVRFQGELDLRQFGLAVPGIAGLEAAVCSAKLIFQDDQRPYFTNVNATLQLPIPDHTNHIDLVDTAFDLDGYPSGRLQLRKDLTLLDLGGFQFVLLGTNTHCPEGNSLTVYPSDGLGQPPAFRLNGSVQVVAPLDMLTEVDGDQAQGKACGSLSLTNGALPQIDLKGLEFGGTFHLGGPNGLLVSNASLSFEGLHNAFELGDGRTLALRLSGSVVVTNGPTFTLTGAQFTFFDPHRLPRFKVEGLGYDATNFQLVQALPAAVDSASLTFKHPDLELPHLLAPANLVWSMSAHVNIPPDDPMLSGRIDNLKMSVTPKGQLQIESLAGLMLEISGLKIPPIEDIGGQLYIGGLEDPAKMYFAGKAAGSYDGYKVKFLVAFNLMGPIGLCLDFNAGGVGIPLDGGYLGGVLLTGASGGTSFVNNNADPCAFTTYMNTNGAPLSTFIELPAAMSWSNLRAVINRSARTAQAFLPNPPVRPKAALTKAAPAAGIAPTPEPLVNGFDCPDRCPPVTINIFCQPHPDRAKFPKRVILKFSSINEKTLNEVLNIRGDDFAWLGNNAVQIGTNAAHRARLHVQENLPPFDPSLPADKTNAMRLILNETLDAAEALFAATLTNALSRTNSDQVYAVIRDTLYAGAPCPDVTLLVTATFSHAAVSSFLSGTVGATVSTAGAAGVVGSVNLLGVPVGEGKLFVAATDDQGLPNPSASGEIDMVVGPLDIGRVRAEIRCPGCVTGLLQDFFKLGFCLSEPLLRQLVDTVAPRLSPLNLPPEQLLQQLSDIEKLAFMAHIYQLPPETTAALPECFKTQFRSLIESLQPYAVLCGQVSPKLFGLPLGDKIVGVSAEASKTNIAGVMGYSPSRMVATSVMLNTTALSLGGAGYVLGGAMFLFPVSDYGQFGFNVSMPDPAEAILAGLSGQLSSAEALKGYAEKSFERGLQESTYTVKADLSILGLKLFSAQERVLLPNLTNHPARPNSGWVLPEQRTTNAISRMEILTAALRAGQLANPFWTGTASELQALFPGDPRIANLDLRHDYFPHGGGVGAYSLDLPVVLTERPPDYLPGLLNPNSEMALQDRLFHAIDYVQHYLLTFTNRGALAYYLPAPNPPYFTNSAGQNLGPKELLEAICSFDFNALTNAAVRSLYPYEYAFCQGFFNASLLGVPMATGSVVVLPPSTQENRTNGVMRVEVDGAPQGWLSRFVTTNHLVFDIHSSPPQPIEQWANDAYAELTALAANPSNLTQEQFEELIREKVKGFTASFATNLPKAKLEADLSVTLPDPISEVLQFTNNTFLRAYSPAYDPNYQPTNHGPVARIMREGGLAFQGTLKLKAGPLTLADIENAEVSVIPKAAGLPELAARLNAPLLTYDVLTFRNVLVDFASAPQPRFNASGEVDLFAIGSFNLLPGAGATLGGQIQVASSGSHQVSVGIRINPARLALPSLYGDTILIHGATRQDPFTFSTTGPWNASLEFTNNLSLLNLVALDFGGFLSPITLQGNGTTHASFTIGFSPSQTLTLFPNHGTLQRTLTLASDTSGSVRVNSDGTFLLNATVGGTSGNINGIAIPVGASLTVSNTGVAFTWTLDNGTATASLAIAADGTVTFNGSTELPPLTLGVFRLSGADGGNLRGSFSPSGFAVDQGARVTLQADWLQNQSLTLSSFTLSNNGAIQVSASNSPADSLLLAGYPFVIDSFTLTRNPTNGGDGVATLGLAGRLRTSPNFPGFPSVAFTGAVSSAGTVFLKSSAANENFFGFPVRNLTNTFSLTAGQFLGQWRSEFCLGDSSWLWSQLGTNWFSGRLSPDGSVTLSADAPQLNVSGFELTNTLFRFERTAGQAPSVSLEGGFAPPGFTPVRLRGGINSSGGIYLVPAPPAPAVPVPYPPLNGEVVLELANSGAFVRGVLHQAPLPSLSLTGMVQTSGAFALTGAVATTTINGFNLGSAQFILQRTNATSAPWLSAQGQLAVPGLGASSVQGRFNPDMTFELSTTLASASLHTSLPVTDLSGGVLKWNQDGVTLAGTLSGGVLTTLVPSPGFSVTGLVSIASDGLQTLSGAVRLQPLTNGLFTIRPPSGTDFLATFGNAGLTLPEGALLQCGNAFSVPLPLPAVVIAKNGTFDVSVGSPLPLSATVNGFGLKEVRFSLVRVTDRTIYVPRFSGALDVPVLNRIVEVSGSIMNHGTLSLRGKFGGAVDLERFNLAVTSLGADAAVQLSESGPLKVTGSVSGGALDSFGLTASAVLAITPPPSPTLTLVSSLSVAPLTLGALQIESTASGGWIDVTVSNNVLVLPANLRLVFNDEVLSARLPAFTIDADGNYGFGQTNVTLTLAGFSITNSSYSFSHHGGATTFALNSGNLELPVFNAPFRPSVSGQLSTDGTYSFGARLSTALSYRSLVNLGSGGGSVTLANGTATVAGYLNGGILNWVSLVGNATGGFSITATNGFKVTPYGSITHAPFSLGPFTLRANTGGNFVSSLSEEGLTIPSGAQLYLNDVLLGNFSLPSIVVPTNGLFSGSVTNVPLKLVGYDVGNVNFSFQRLSLTSMSLPSFSGTLFVPHLGWQVPLTGGINASGFFDLVNSTSFNRTLTDLPVGSFAASPAPTLHLRKTATETSLTVAGQLTGKILDHLPAPVLSATGLVSVATSGNLTLSGSVTLPALRAGPFTVGAGNGGNFTAQWNNTGLYCSGLSLAFSPLGTALVTLPAFTIPETGDFLLQNLSLPTVNLAAFPFKNLTLDLRRTPSQMWLPALRAQLNFNLPPLLTDLNKYLVGSVDATGNFNLVQENAGLLVGTFNAFAGSLTFKGTAPALVANCPIDLRAFNRTLASGVVFGGQVLSSGSFIFTNRTAWALNNLPGPSGTGDHVTSGSGAGAWLNLTSLGLNGADILQYGNLRMPITIPSWTDNVLSFHGQKSFNVTVSLTPPHPPLTPEPPGVHARLAGDIVINANSTELSFSCEASAQFSAYDDIGNRFDAKAVRLNLGLDGKASVGESFGGIDGFDFWLW